jgi:transposase
LAQIAVKFAMAHEFRTNNPYQSFLFPPSTSDWLSENHVSYFVRDLVSELDLSEFLAGYSSDGRGARAFAPSLMLSVILYGWLRSVYSCRKLASMCMDDVGARMLVGDERPDFRSLNRFRLRHAKAIKGLYLQSVKLCGRVGLVTLTDVAIDGTRISSFASNKRNIFYGRIADEESRHLEFLRRANERADAEDAAEDALYGEDNEGPVVPEALKTAAGRLALIREAKAAMEAEAKARAIKDKERYDKSEPRDRPKRKPVDPDKARPKQSAQYNAVDPDARIQFSSQSGFLLGYNGQIAVDAKSQVIVACDLVREGVDNDFLIPVLSAAISNTGLKPDYVLADRGYYAAKYIEQIESLGMSALIPPPLKKSERERGVTKRDIENLPTRSRIRQMFTSLDVKERFKKRAQSVEPVFGQIKGSPGNSKYARFLRRGLDKCREDWTLLCSVHNLGKLYNWKKAIG